MEKEKTLKQIRLLEQERCRVLKEYHEVAQKLDYIDYQLHKLKQQMTE